MHDIPRVQLSVSFQGLPCRMPVPILKHRLELESISHVVSLVSFLDVKAENNFTNKIVAHQTTIESPKNSSLLFIHILTLSRAEPIITVHMLCKKKKCCALQENVVCKQLTLYDQETTDQYVVDCKVLTV